MRYLAFYKPYEILSQFTDREAGRGTLKDYIHVPGVYPAGRLDYRSEGLLILSDDGPFIQRLTDPAYNHPKIYLAEVEHIPTPENLHRLETEILLPDLQTRTARAVYLKIARDERDCIPIIVSGDDIVWVAGYRADERFKVTETTKKCVRLGIVPGKF